MSKHTQQEWQRDGTTVYSLNVEGANRFVAQVQGGWATQGRNRTEAEEIEANARLIAAAPEILSALIAAMHRLKEIEVTCDIPVPYQMSESARAAIAKATGQ
jgi:hypothetical protein